MKMNTDKDWLRRRAELEDGCFVSVGGLVESWPRESKRQRTWFQ